MTSMRLARPAAAVALATLATLAAAAGPAAPPPSAPTVLRIGYATSKDSHYGVGATVFCEEMEKATQGRFKCQHFPASALGGEREQIESVLAGTQDLANVSTGALGPVAPEVKIFDLPFLFRGYEHARKVLDGPIGEEVLARVRLHGLVGLAWTENGFRHITNSRRPVVNAEDLRGLRLRTMESKVHVEAYRAFGVVPVPMPFPEVYGALQQGAVDGQENPIPVILSARFSQVQKYLSLTAHVYSPALVLMSTKVWERLSEPDRRAFVAAAQKGCAAQRRRVNEDEAHGVAQLRKDGMQVVEQVNADSFRRAVAPAYAAFAREFGAERIASIQAVK